MKLEVATGEGVAEAYAYTGGKLFDAARPCVVFLHGVLHDHSVWTLPARWFANHGHAVLALDLPGHGRSGGAPLASVEALADWLLNALDAAGVRRAALVGHSLGSLVALEAASRAPARVSRLVMVGTAYPMKVSAMLLDGARDHVEATIDSVNAFSHASLAAKPAHPGPGTWLHGANRALMRRTQRGRPDANPFRSGFEACDRYAGGIAAAARVACPATLILGARDQMTPPANAVDIGAALRARTVTLAAGHAVQTEAPDALLAALREALAPESTPSVAPARQAP